MPVMGVIIACLTAIETWTVAHKEVVRWVDVSGALRSHGFLAAGALAAWACVVGQCSRSLPGSIDASPNRSTHFLTHMVPIAGVGIGASVMGLVPVLLAAFDRSSAGGFEPITFVGSLAVLAATATIFLGLGFMTSSPLAPAISLAAPWIFSWTIYALIELVFNGVSLYGASPWWMEFGPDQGWVDNTATETVRLILFLSVILAGVIFWVQAGPNRRRSKTLVAAVPLLFAAAITVVQPELISLDNRPLVCSDDRLVCVNADSQRLIDAAHLGASEAVDALGYGVANPSPPRGEGTFVVKAVDLNSQTTTSRLAAERATVGIVGADYCVERVGANPLTTHNITVLYSIVTSAMVNRGYDVGAGFSPITNEQITAYLEQNSQAITSCEVELPDAPTP